MSTSPQATNSPRIAGRHFLQIPGPSPVPDRILQAMAMPVIDHRGPAFQKLGQRVLGQIKTIFKTDQPVIIYPASGTGAWEAALANTMSPGDKVLMYESGHFAFLWKDLALKLGIEPEFIASDWRHGVDPARIEERLRQDTAHEIKAVCVVHNETSTGATSDIAAVRKAIDAAGHPALLMVDTISGLASADYRHDEWGVDVTVSGSQKGLMLPPGISFNAVSEKAPRRRQGREAAQKLLGLGRDDRQQREAASFPIRPQPTCFMRSPKPIDMLHEEGLDNVFARHQPPWRSDPARGRGLGPREPDHRAEGFLARPHCRPHARWP